jgi:hypothetical protein
MALFGTQTVDVRTDGGRIMPVQGSAAGQLGTNQNFKARLPDGTEFYVLSTLVNIPAGGLLVRREDGFEQRIYPTAT